MGIHQEVVVEGDPQRVYQALTDATQFSAFSGGAPARISSDAGGEFSVFGGMIEGRHIELVSGRRIVQAWRAKPWDAGVYSIVRFEISAHGAQTKIVLDHTGFPEGQSEHLAAGWTANYWEPLKKHLAA